MNDQIVRRLLFLAIVLSVVLCVGGCARTATKVEGDTTVFTLPISDLVIRTTMISFFLGIVLLGGVIAPIQALVVKLRSTLTLSASQQEPAEPISTGTKSDKDEIGWQGLVVWLLIGPLVGSYFLYNLGQSVHADFNDKVTLSDSGFTSDVWMGFELHRQQYSFDDIQVIHARHTRRRSGKYGAPRKSYATVSLKSGHQEEIRVNEVLTSAWPEIARKAVAKGVPIEGDF